MEHEPLKTVLDPAWFPDIQKYFIDQTYQFQELMMKYNCAIREVRTKLEVLNDELNMRHRHSPIEFITSRVKSPLSIAEKLKRYGSPMTVEAIEGTLNDVAGIRVICSFIDDIYAVRDMLIKQDDITLVIEKDYIKNPKPNGYRSLHLILEIPVFFSDQKKPMRVEVQIRTIAMDFWASVDHQLKYKQDIENPEAISAELKECADIIAQTDLRMQSIKNKIYAGSHPDLPESEKLEKLRLSF